MKSDLDLKNVLGYNEEEPDELIDSLWMFDDIEDEFPLVIHADYDEEEE